MCDPTAELGMKYTSEQTRSSGSLGGLLGRPCSVCKSQIRIHRQQEMLAPAISFRPKKFPSVVRPCGRFLIHNRDAG